MVGFVVAWLVFVVVFLAVFHWHMSRKGEDE